MAESQIIKDESITTQNKNLLVVDDEILFLKILEKMFQNHYNIKIATSGKEGLQVIQNGFKPAVIVSDQKMPEMTGSEFLEETIKIVPEAIRVILTGISIPKDIINAISQAQAYMYLTKPIEEMSLIQSVRIAFDTFNAKIKNNQLNSEIHSLRKKLHTIQESNQPKKEQNDIIIPLSKALSGIFSTDEKFYFSSHTKFITTLSKAISEEIDSNPKFITNVTLSCLLQTLTNVGLPSKILLFDPYELSNEDDLNIYFLHFNNILSYLKYVDDFKEHITIISHLWEHIDGTGFPNKLSGNEIRKEAQIIALAKIYHNGIYRLKYDSLNKFLLSGKVSQTYEETKARQGDTLKFLYRKGSWFDLDIFNAFNDVIRKKTIKDVIIEDKTLNIHYIDKGLFNDFSDLIDKEVDILEENPAEDVDFDLSPSSKKMVEIDITIDQLEPGMQITHSILTKNRLLILKPDTIIDNTAITNLKHQYSAGLIPSKVSILIPQKDIDKYK
ncbi:MAG TPA: response regulator [Candidatus Kapabacteria bacterium]|nr:response regulator [Candidatus Kapabacteria bacterium]HPO64011.1 response regulator [Candidatus Kapabacteria bacterium]